VIGKIVLTVANENHDAANDVRLIAGRSRRIAEVFCAGFINCVVDSSAAASAHLDDLIAQKSCIARKT